mgnify:CR=1 FL=1
MELRVASYNIDCRLCDWPKHEHGPSWSARAARERSILTEINPDIVFLQEPLLATDPSDVLPLHRNWSILFEHGKSILPLPLFPNYDPDATLAVDANKFTIHQSGSFWLGPHPSKPGSFDILTLPRLATWARLSFKANATSSSFIAISTHFDHGDGTGKSKGPSTTNCVQAARELSSMLNNRTSKIGQGGLPVVFGGDLNSKVSSHAYRLLLNSTELKDTWEAAANRTKVYANTTAAAAAYSYNHSIDHIMTTPQWEVLRAGSSVRVWSWKDGQKTKTAAPSDHFPVWAEVRLSVAE